MKYRRILLKLSGEALAGDRGIGIDRTVLLKLAGELREVHHLGVSLVMVLGGGNIFRGIAGATKGMERSSADYMGMLATIINSMAMQDALENCGVDTRLLTAIEMKQVGEPFIRRRAIRHLEKGRVVIVGGGTGNPYFSTDTAACLRAVELGADVVCKGTKVDGVYSEDPLANPGAVLYREIGYTEFLEKNLRVMDSTAVSMCRDNEMPIIIFNLTHSGNIKRVIAGEQVGTMVR